MKRLIATIILVTIVIALAGCNFTYHHPGYHHGYGHGAVIVTRPVYVPCPPGYPHGHHGHYPGRHSRRF
ncbi:MAG: hypothetical protein U9Q07_05285 [Planctomycetota bacterium]|nr:hypothetical protein [Planctomycetota bacterium]